jgi:glutathione S-transferase
MIELYDYVLSTDAYKVRLLLGLLGVEYTIRNVEFYPGREHRSEWFLKINPRGELPVLSDAGVYVEDAQMILEYVAKKFDPARTWHPAGDVSLTGLISMWLSFADALTPTAAAARLHDGFLYRHIDVDAARGGAHELLRKLDEHLWFNEEAGRAWLCPPSRPTIADLACFPDVMVAEEGGVSLAPYRAIRRWTDRIKRLPAFETMPGIFPI